MLEKDLDSQVCVGSKFIIPLKTSQFDNLAKLHCR